MSRSFKKNPAGGIAKAGSEKRDKQSANRKFRRLARVAMCKGTEAPLMREVSNVYDMSKDGKYWHGSPWDSEYLWFKWAIHK